MSCPSSNRSLSINSLLGCHVMSCHVRLFSRVPEGLAPIAEILKQHIAEVGTGDLLRSFLSFFLSSDRLERAHHLYSLCVPLLIYAFISLCLAVSSSWEGIKSNNDLRGWRRRVERVKKRRRGRAKRRTKQRTRRRNLQTTPSSSRTSCPSTISSLMSSTTNFVAMPCSRRR
jgi:hypothetical protein